MPRLTRLSAYGPALLTGLGLGLSYPPSPFPFLAWVALVPLLLRWERAASAGRLLGEAYLALLVTFAVAFYWPLCHALPQAALAALSPLLALPLVMALPFGAAVLIRRHLGRVAGWLALPSLFLVMEGGLSRGPLAFPWPLLGHTQAEALWINQFVELTGVPGLTLWLWLLNGAAVMALRPATRRKGLALFALLVLLPLAFSLWRRAHLPPPVRTVTAGLVQPALPPEAWADVRDTTRVDTLMALSTPLLSPPPAVLIWPETALPITRTAADLERLQDWVRRHGVPLLTGGVLLPEGEAAYRNSALLLTPEGPIQRYDKIHLVPFGERVPFVDTFPALRRLSVPAGGVAGYAPGHTWPLLRTDSLSVGVMICFESAFGNHPRPYLEQGADFLVTLTQDGWWGPTPGYRQHLALTRLRAIEARRAVVQVSVSGITALILPDGSTPRSLGWMERATLRVRIPVLTSRTWYSRHGDLLTGLALLVALALGGLTLRVAHRTRRG